MAVKQRKKGAPKGDADGSSSGNTVTPALPGWGFGTLVFGAICLVVSVHFLLLLLLFPCGLAISTASLIFKRALPNTRRPQWLPARRRAYALVLPCGRPRSVEAPFW